MNTVVQGPSASSLSEVMRTSGFTRLAGLSGALAVGLGEPNFEIVKKCNITIPNCSASLKNLKMFYKFNPWKTFQNFFFTHNETNQSFAFV